ncbi:SDR family oxidoreductase [Paraburkholderia sp. RAU2J]|uniref:SDR family oxidoreductase n=1 Tax=Paraburkholderia sp. RAU2J TaxID=1938810 RepID=UPI001F54169E|nr:SDR family oxidoreductase [Paraburkholderia sp. RAU2J]
MGTRDQYFEPGRDDATTNCTRLFGVQGRYKRHDRVIADAIAFLASPLAGYITGVNLRVDGGLSPIL